MSAWTAFFRSIGNSTAPNPASQAAFARTMQTATGNPMFIRGPRDKAAMIGIYSATGLGLLLAGNGMRHMMFGTNKRPDAP